MAGINNSTTLFTESSRNRGGISARECAILLDMLVAIKFLEYNTANQKDLSTICHCYIHDLISIIDAEISAIANYLDNYKPQTESDLTIKSYRMLEHYARTWDLSLAELSGLGLIFDGQAKSFNV